MRNFKTEGIIIKRTNYKDSDRILTVLTKTNGKIYVKAAGVRKITSRRAGHIEPLNHSMLTLYQGNGFPILTEAQTLSSFAPIKTDLDFVARALHLCEVVDGLCAENQENMRVFTLLRETLEKLSRSVVVNRANNLLHSADKLQNNSLSIIGEFEVELLKMLGFWNEPQFAQAIDSQAYIENILERRLKSHNIFTKLQ